MSETEIKYESYFEEFKQKIIEFFNRKVNEYNNKVSIPNNIELDLDEMSLNITLNDFLTRDIDNIIYNGTRMYKSKLNLDNFEISFFEVALDIYHRFKVNFILNGHNYHLILVLDLVSPFYRMYTSKGFYKILE